MRTQPSSLTSCTWSRRRSRIVADAIKAKLATWGVEPEFYVIDPSARNRTQINADAVEAEFQRHGIYAVHGQNDRESGILTIKRRFQGNPPSLLSQRLAGS
jgi:hypothetical protein